jgi:hypothetical protein
MTCANTWGGLMREFQEVRRLVQYPRNLGIELQIANERNPEELDGIFVAVQESSALVVADDAEFTAHRAQIAELALRHRLPIVPDSGKSPRRSPT